MKQDHAVKMIKDAGVEGEWLSSDLIKWRLNPSSKEWVDFFGIELTRAEIKINGWGSKKYSDDTDIVRVGDYIYEHESHIRTPNCLKTLWEFPATEDNMIKVIDLYKELVEIYKRGEKRLK